MLGLLQSLVDPISTILDKFVEDKDTRMKLAHEIATMAERHAHEISLGQIEVNKVEAASGSWFKGGWRPFVGWVCGAALAYHFILHPVIVFAILVSDVTSVDPNTLPQFDMDSLMTVLLGMLGLGGLRTYEKKQGIAK